VRNGAPVSCLEVLLFAYPVSITIQDPDGNLPIHLACKFDKTCVNLNLLDLFSLLANLYLDSLMLTDRAGNLPLAIQLKHHGPANAILACIAKEPRALEFTDAKGNIPLHLGKIKKIEKRKIVFLLRDSIDVILHVDTNFYVVGYFDIL
jgi:hypothetical protein